MKKRKGIVDEVEAPKAHDYLADLYAVPDHLKVCVCACVRANARRVRRLTPRLSKPAGGRHDVHRWTGPWWSKWRAVRCPCRAIFWP